MSRAQPRSPVSHVLPLLGVFERFEERCEALGLITIRVGIKTPLCRRMRFWLSDQKPRTRRSARASGCRLAERWRKVSPVSDNSCGSTSTSLRTSFTHRVAFSWFLSRRLCIVQQNISTICCLVRHKLSNKPKIVQIGLDFIIDHQPVKVSSLRQFRSSTFKITNDEKSTKMSTLFHPQASMTRAWWSVELGQSTQR